MRTTRTPRPPRNARRPVLARWREALRDDSGASTLIEIVVTMFIAVILWGIGTKILHATTHGQSDASARVAVQSGELDAAGQIGRDLHDGISMRVATDQALVVTVVRDGLCQERSYLADGTTAHTMTVQTKFYPTASCSGTPKVNAPKILIPRYTQTKTFTYWGESPTIPIPAPVTDVRNVQMVGWSFSASPYVDRVAPDETLASLDIWKGLGDASGTGVQQLQGVAPALTVTMPSPPMDFPQLSWTMDAPHLGDVAGWRIIRATQPEGARDEPYQGIQWIQDPAVMSWSDASLLPGARGTYLVQAVLRDGTDGPLSASVDVGRRPAAPTDVKAGGAATSITVSWTRSAGAAGGYDIYRDNALIANVGNVSSWTDSSAGFGRSSVYSVSAVNRWENLQTTGSEDGRVSPGDQLTKAYVGKDGIGVVRLSSAASAFTAPAAPALTVDAGDRASALSWTPAPWVGSGPVPATTWTVTYRSSTEGASTVATTAGTSWTHPSRPAGRFSDYSVTGSDTSGVGPASAWGRVWQRPATPSCSIPSVTTRSLQSAADPLVATADEAYSNYQVAINSDPWVANATMFDPLSDGTGYAFRVQVQGAGGWSDAGSCGGTTAALVAAPPICSISGGGTAPNGSVTINASGGSSGTYEYSPAHYRTGLGAGTWTDGSARAAATDGYNTTWSGWASCSGTVTVAPSPYPSGFGNPDGCPGVAIYVKLGDPYTYNVQRTGVDTCQAREVVTQAGEDSGTGFVKGYVTGYYAWKFSTGGPAWIKTSGVSANTSLPSGV